MVATGTRPRKRDDSRQGGRTGPRFSTAIRDPEGEQPRLFAIREPDLPGSRGKVKVRSASEPDFGFGRGNPHSSFALCDMDVYRFVGRELLNESLSSVPSLVVMVVALSLQSFVVPLRSARLLGGLGAEAQAPQTCAAETCAAPEASLLRAVVEIGACQVLAVACPLGHACAQQHMHMTRRAGARARNLKGGRAETRMQ